MSESNRPLPLQPKVAPGERIYAIGDIHGRDDLLAVVHRGIAKDLTENPAGQPAVVYLGDYVDRGPESFEVLDRLIYETLPGVRSIHLRGNHEQMMLDFIDHADTGAWMMNGADATLVSYGVQPPLAWADTDDLRTAQAQLRAALPEGHLQFLRETRLSHSSGDYLFVHAGVRPGRPIDQQEDRDLIWIRGAFLSSPLDFGKRVVHGHSISPEPDIRPNRIGIDTGAYFSGRLTCLVLEGETVRFLG